MKILFFKPPRYQWPFHSEHSSFWQPLGFCSMAAVLREELDDVEIKIIDCPALRIGWKTAKRILRKEAPDILCLGEETVSVHEAFKAIRFVKSINQEANQETKIICGGNYFTYMVADSLNSHPIDFIVKFEGEATLLELVKEMRKQPSDQNLRKIKGIAYKKDGKIIETELRQLVDMENLPFPAYDLLDMRAYGSRSRNHKNFVAIEHSRGCTCACNFCVLWKQMGRIDMKTGKINPCYRTKSVRKTVDEIIMLADKYRRKTFCWVDPTWNVDPKWNLEFSKSVISEGLDIDHSVWYRADFVVRDELNGSLKHQVKAGVKQAMVGVERTDDDDLAYFEKANYSYNTVKHAFEILNKYPSVLSVATYIYGIPNETKSSLNRFYNLLKEIPFDIGVPIPLTPNPGTRFFEELENKNLLEIKDFKYYNFINPVARSKYMSKNQLLFQMMKNEVRIRARKEHISRHGINKIFQRRRLATRNLALSKFKITMNYLNGIFSNVFFNKNINLNVRPKWYDS